MTPTISILIMLASVPILAAALFAYVQSLPTRLAIWYAYGWLMSQWIHVMLFVLNDRLLGKTETTYLQIAHFYRAKWWQILFVGIAFGAALSIVLRHLVDNPTTLRLRPILLIVLVSLIISQMVGSSIPKFFGELGIATTLLVGLVLHFYFLTYAPNGQVTPAQVQSDALTSLGLIVTLVSIIWPCGVSFGHFLHDGYFAQDLAMRQFQMTRYAAYGIWWMIGVGLLLWRCVELLVAARQGLLELP